MFSKEDFNRNIGKLRDKKLIRIYYLQINYEKNEPYWNLFSNEFDYLDFGLVLEFEGKLLYQISWDSQFYQFGLSYKKIDSILDTQYVKVWDVTFNTSWQNFLNKKIIELQVFWDVGFEGDKEFEYPQDIEISFENGSHVYLSASCYLKEDDKFMGYSDEVVVIFNSEIAQKYEIGLYRKPCIH